MYIYIIINILYTCAHIQYHVNGWAPASSRHGGRSNTSSTVPGDGIRGRASSAARIVQRSSMMGYDVANHR